MEKEIRAKLKIVFVQGKEIEARNYILFTFLYQDKKVTKKIKAEFFS
ncbi:MAG: hypothetical protein WAT92_12820 [Saprospiraceae bacterium]